MTNQIFASIKNRIGSFFSWDSAEVANMTASELDDKLQTEVTSLEDWKATAIKDLDAKTAASSKELNEKFDALNASLETLKGEKAASDEAVKELTASVEELTEKNKTLSASKTTLESQIATLKGAPAAGKGKGNKEPKVSTPEDSFYATLGGPRHIFSQEEA